MKKIIIISTVLLSSLVLLAAILAAKKTKTTWFNVEVECPLCQTKNTFSEIGSYGGYIYNWPSKYQYIYWPSTDEHVLYSCAECKLTTYMWDFKSIAEKDHEKVKIVLQNQTVDKKTNHYSEMPMSVRCEIAESVYKVLSKDSLFWCDFYRMYAYHLDKENKKEDAFEKRKKALAYAEGMLQNHQNDSIAKSLHYICGTLNYFTNKKKAASLEFEKTLMAKYTKGSNAEQVNEYLNELSKEYLEKLKNNEPIDR